MSLPDAASPTWRTDLPSPAPGPAPVTLAGLSVRDLGPWSAVRLDFDPTTPQTIVLLGDNASGKTALLRALVLALLPNGLPTAIQFDDDTPQLIRLGQEKAEVEVDFGEKRATLTLTPEGARRDQNPPPTFVVAYGARRSSALGGHSKAVNYSPKVAVGTLFSEATDLIHTRTFLALQKERPNDGLAPAISALLARLLPGVEEVLVESGEVTLRWKDGRATPLSVASDGYVTTVGWVVDMVARWWNHEHAAGQPVPANFAEQMVGVAVVDEVDLHLHPRWQRRIIDTIREIFPRMTFVFSTHSALTLLGRHPTQVFRCARTSQGFVAEKLPPIDAASAESLLTGAWFGLDTTVDQETADLLVERAEAVRTGSGDVAALTDRVQARLRGGRSTAWDRMALEALDEVVADLAAEATPEARALGRDRLKALIRAKLKPEGA